MTERVDFHSASREKVDLESSEERLEADLLWLGHLFSFVSDTKVHRYHNKYPVLVKAIEDANVAISDVFGTHRKRRVADVVYDPDEDYGSLVVTTWTDLGAGPALDLLEKLGDEWWLGLEDEVRALMTITV